MEFPFSQEDRQTPEAPRRTPFRRVITLSLTVRYAVAVAAASAAILVRLALDPLWGIKLPYVTLFPAIMLSAWLGGLGPGIVTTVITAAAATYFWIEPVRSWEVADPSDLLGTAVFLGIGLFISAFNEAWRRGTQALTESEERLRTAEQERTALLEAERAARGQSEATAHQLQAALQAGKMGTWHFTLATGDVHWSAGLEAIHGYAPGMFPGTFEAFRQEIHPDDRDRVLQTITNAVEERREHRIEYRIVRVDGSTRWVEGVGDVLWDEDGRPRQMIGVCTDITERKQAEERFRLAVEAAPAAMLMVDSKGTIVLANALTEQILGYTSGDIIGRGIDELVPPRFRGKHGGYRAGFLADARPRPMGAGRALHAVRKDGSEVRVEIGLSPIETGEGVFVLAAVTDITARVEADEERERVSHREQTARTEMERASRMKDEFLAVLSHELRTPLNAVLGYAHLLLSGALPPERTNHALRAIQRNAQSQAQLVESLLDLSRVMAGKLELLRQPLELTRTIEAAIDVVRPDADAREVTIDVLPPASPAMLVADGARLQQVFWNLLSNAIKFTQRGGHVTIQCTREGDDACIHVRDNGYGIRPDFLPHVFDRFQQGDGPARGAGAGLGLGLALVREIVHAHGGTVTAESEGEGRGSTFIVRLPLSAAATPPVPATPGPAHSDGPDSLSGLEILIVDDDADARDLVALLLESRGALTRTAASARDALDSIQQQRPDMLLADVLMPDEDGYWLIRTLRESERRQGRHPLPAIAVTAQASMNDREQTIAAGFDWHVAKPVEPEELVRAITRIARVEHV